MIETVFPEAVIIEECGLDNVSGTIYPEELVFIEKAVKKRRNDFIGGRICAKKALSRLGIENFPVLMADDRSPLWPTGVVGSISHTHGYCGVAVANNKHFRSLGLDIENVDRIKSDCRRLICTDEEQSRINRLPENDQQRFSALTFSAKESFFKCQYFLNRCWAGFHDAEIFADISVDEGAFSIIMLKDIGTHFKKDVSYNGLFSFNQGYVITGMTV